MYEVLPTTATLPITRDPDLDRAFAEGAALYLRRQGLDHRAIVSCLVDEFDMDKATAAAIADLAKSELDGR